MRELLELTQVSFHKIIDNLGYASKEYSKVYEVNGKVVSG